MKKKLFASSSEKTKKEAFHGIKHGMSLFFVLFHKILKKT